MWERWEAGLFISDASQTFVSVWITDRLRDSSVKSVSCRRKGVFCPCASDPGLDPQMVFESSERLFVSALFRKS